MKCNFPVLMWDIGTDELQVGVMADEVLKVIPEAVSMDADGYYLVDYGMLQ